MPLNLEMILLIFSASALWPYLFGPNLFHTRWPQNVIYIGWPDGQIALVFFEAENKPVSSFSRRLDNKEKLKIGCGSVGRAVTSDTRGPQFKSSFRNFYIDYLSPVNFIEKKKRPGKGSLKMIHKFGKQMDS